MRSYGYFAHLFRRPTINTTVEPTPKGQTRAKPRDRAAGRPANLGDPNKAMVQELVSRMRQHDWEFDEGDGERWIKGCEQRDAIIELLRKLPEHQAKAIWEANAPETYEFPINGADDQQLPFTPPVPPEIFAAPQRRTLVETMATHDWYFDYSDDSNVWAAGKAKDDAILARLKELPQDQAKAIWEEHAPKDRPFPFEELRTVSVKPVTQRDEPQVAAPPVAAPPIVPQIPAEPVTPVTATVSPTEPLKLFSAVNAGVLLFFGAVVANAVAFYLGYGWIVFSIMVVGAMIAARDVHKLCTFGVYWSFRMGVPAAAVVTFSLLLGAVADIAAGGILWRACMLGCVVLGCLSFLGHVTAKAGAAVCSAVLQAESSNTTLTQTQT